MNVKEFYQHVGGNYDEVMSRLLTEKRVCKYLNKLPQTGDIENMNTAFAEKRWEDAFRFSHNMKGMSLNLSLTKLAEVSAELCDTVRHGAPEVDVDPLIKAVNDRYQLVISALGDLEEQ